jgi:hypothetical protein
VPSGDLGLGYTAWCGLGAPVRSLPVVDGGDQTAREESDRLDGGHLAFVVVVSGARWSPEALLGERQG